MGDGSSWRQGRERKVDGVMGGGLEKKERKRERGTEGRPAGRRGGGGGGGGGQRWETEAV